VWTNSLVVSLLVSILAQTATAAQQVSVRHQFDLTGTGGSSLSLPSDVAITQSHIVVVDSGNDRLLFFSKKGNFVFDIGNTGASTTEFNAPVGIGTDRKGNIFVADTRNHRVQVFNRKGRFKLSIPITEDGEPVRPIDVAVDAKRKLIFVTGNNNHKVMTYGVKGSLINDWGGNGDAVGQFRYPATIALMANDRIGVVDVLNTRAQVFKYNGDHSIQIGDWGVLPGQLFRPKGIAVDKDQRVYISDSYMNVIQVFDDEGRFLHVLDTSSAGRPLDTPSGIAVSEGILYVVEMMANRVSVFKLDDMKP
jgi:DNA-binding beta-propeller fold protein YncE